MKTCTLAHVAMASALALAFSPGCGGRSPTAPADGSPQALTVTGVLPSTGWTSGTTVVQIAGTGFQPGAIVTLGGPATGVTVVNHTRITATVPAHAAGAVDVVVTNPGAQSVTLANGFTYVIAQRATITSVSPDIGTTEGGTSLRISGSDFLDGVTVTVGGVEIQPTIYLGSMFLSAPPHGAGPVDVVVTNPGAEPHVLEGAYTYAPPASFDFNGTWDGYADPEQHFVVKLTIENDRLTSVSCGGSEPLTFTDGARVRNGAFSFSDERGWMSGRILSRSQASGTINVGPCRDVLWDATKP